MATISIKGPMKSIDERLREIDAKIRAAMGTYESILAIHTQVDRKKRSLEVDLKNLENQKLHLTQGQLDFDSDLPF